MAVLMSKTIDLLGFNGYDFEMNSINAQKVNVVQSMIVNDVRNNVRIGTEAGDNLTTGYNNIIFGNHSGKYITIGHDNIILGTYAGYKINESYENCIMGMESAYNLTSGARNCTYGYRCGYAMDICEFNTLMGNYCGASLVGGTSIRNVMIGFNCGYYPTHVVESVYIGQKAGQNMGGAYNVAVGLNAGASDLGTSITDATSTVFVGFGAGTYALDGIMNTVCVGTSAGERLDAAKYCVYVGTQCGRYAKGDYNVYMGNECGDGWNYSTNNTGIGFRSLLSGGGDGYNVACGSDCLSYLTTGTRCVAIGYYCALSADDAHDIVCIGSSCASDLVSGYNVVAIGTEALQYPGATSIDQIAIGYRAAYISTGTTNIAIGTSALGNENEEVTGSYNVCLGPYAAMNLTWGESNVIAGYQSCMEGGGTSKSIIYGFQAMKYGEANRAVALGYQAAYRNKANDNTALGTSALGGGEDDGGNVRSADATHVQLALNAASDDDYYKYLYVVTLTGTGAGQARQITATLPTLAYVGSTRTATISPAWSTIPDTSTTYIISNQMDSGTSLAGSTANSIVLRADSSTITNRFLSCYCVLTSGAGAGQIRIITSYNGSIHTAYVSPNWATIPVAGTDYEIYPTATNGYNLIAIGSYSGLRITDNYDSICIGTNSARMGGGYENISMGISSLRDLVNGPHNICIGKESAASLKDGETNCIIGYKAGRNMGASAFVGKLPAGIIDTNSGNVLYGYEAGYKLCGPMNLCIGTQAGFSEPLGIGLTNAAGNIIIGFHGPFYRSDSSTSGIYKDGVGQLVIGNSLTIPPFFIPPLLMGTMPYAPTGDPLYPGQTAQFMINCLNADGATTGEIINAGLVAKIGGVYDVTYMGSPINLTAAQLRNHVIKVTNVPGGSIYIKLPSAIDIAALFPNPYNFNPWPRTGMHFDITIIYVANSGTLSIWGDDTPPSPGITTVVIPGNNVIPYGFARTLKLYFTSSTTVTALVC